MEGVTFDAGWPSNTFKRMRQTAKLLPQMNCCNTNCKQAQREYISRIKQENNKQKIINYKVTVYKNQNCLMQEY